MLSPPRWLEAPPAGAIGLSHPTPLPCHRRPLRCLTTGTFASPASPPPPPSSVRARGERRRQSKREVKAAVMGADEAGDVVVAGISEAGEAEAAVADGAVGRRGGVDRSCVVSTAPLSGPRARRGVAKPRRREVGPPTYAYVGQVGPRAAQVEEV
ncbi:hypothetical protein BS78_03G410800 [Paspalum vaginatum]|nr:hypothetical protein BS78_03G410800 [Paspalum vaginatum]